MSKIKALILSVLLAMPAIAGTPPYFTKDPATNENFRDVYEKLAAHQHDEDGTMRLDTVIIPSRSDIDNAITSKKAGQVYFDSISLVVCMSTQAASSTAWALVTSSSTVCPH